MTKRIESRAFVCALLTLGCAGCAGSESVPVGPTDGRDGEAADTVRTFYDRFNAHSFGDAEAFTTEDWNLIDPSGVWSQGQAKAIKRIESVHAKELSQLNLQLDDLSVSFAGPDVAVATATSHEFSWAGGGQRLRSTFVLKESDGRWALAQTQHTFIVEDGPAVRGSSTEVLEDVGGGNPLSEDERVEAVREAVARHDALQHPEDYDQDIDFVAEDFSVIGPTGFWNRGREASLAHEREVVAAFLEGVTGTVEESSVRFLSEDVALITELAVLSPFTPPDGIERRNQRMVASTVVVNHGGAWLLKHIHVTPVDPGSGGM